MANENGFSGTTVLMSFLIGGLVGAGVALLMAPQSGAETRRRIREYAGDTAEKAAEYYGEAKEKVAGTIEKGRHFYEDQKAAFSSAIDAGKEAYARERDRHLGKGDA